MSEKLEQDIINQIIEDLDKKEYHDLDKYYGTSETSVMTKSVLKKKYLAPWEGSVYDLWTRLAWGCAQAEKDKIKYFRKFFTILKDFSFLPGGRINYGLGRDDINVSYSNCYVVPIKEDSLSAIYDCVKESAMTYKVGGGVGVDLSVLRPKNDPILGTGGNSCGSIGFMDLFSVNTDTVSQQNRRGALMLSMLVSHPDIEGFINIKNDVKVELESLNKLMQQYPEAINDLELLKSRINGRRMVQHANISVKLTDDFLQAVENNEMFNLEWGGKVYKQINAKDLWDKIVKNAWESAEPGLIFWDRMKETNNLEYVNPILSTNPCIVGETLIAVADGRNAVSIKQLCEEAKNVPVYSTNLKTGQVEIKMGRSPRKTGEKKEVWKVILDDDSSFIATPNHKVLCKNLSYKNLKDLKEGDSIFPFNSFVSNRYRQISSIGKKTIGGAIRNRRQYRVIHEFYNNDIVDAKQYAVHYKNYNSFDDRFENLKHEEHKKIHSEKMLGLNNPYFKKSDEWRENFRKLAAHHGDTNGRYIKITNEELIERGKVLYNKIGKITKKDWYSYAKLNNLPRTINRSCRFGSWGNFKSLVINNHKVKKISFYGYEDVYNISVDDNENYHIITSFQDEKYIASSGICIKNCSEIPLGAYGNCLLGHMNLPRFVEEGVFNFDKFEEYIQIAVRFLDNVVTLNDGRHALKEQNDTARGERRIGLGITGLGDALILLGLKYGKDKNTLDFIDKVMCLFKNTAYKTSCSLAEEKGSFPWFDFDKFSESKFFKGLDVSIKESIEGSGIRNGMLLTCAPVGTGSIIAETSSGIEPIFRTHFKRRIKQNEGNSFEEFIVCHPLLEKLFSLEVDFPNYVVDSSQVSPEDRIMVQSVVQKHIDNSISSTVNLPNHATVEDVSDIYLLAWKTKCKGVTVYREGSRDGILISIPDKKTETLQSENLQSENLQSEGITNASAIKRPTILIGETHKRKIDITNKQPYNCYITVNFEPNSKKPYELFVTETNSEKDVKDLMMMESITRLTSLLLRHNVPLKFIVQQLEKIKSQYFFSLPISIASILRNYMGEEDNFEQCPECEEFSLHRENGCFLCSECGFSKCS